MSLPRRTTVTACSAAAAAAALTLALLPAGAASSSVSGPAPAAAAQSATTLPTTGLDILLTNDDGWNAPGIQAVYEALTTAGHHVTMAAPATNQSGVSARVAFGGTVDVVNRGETKWSVSGSPVTSVIFGLEHLLKNNRPDLVVSGTNVGANTGFDTNYSGTIGAATVAAGAYDLPAIAFSTDTVHGSEATAAYAQSADLLVDMIGHGIPDLPRGQFINVNYPLLSADRPAPLGLRYATNSMASQAAFSFTQGEGDSFTIVPGRSSEVPAPGTDAAVLKAGYVSVGLLDADRSIEADQATDVTALVRRVSGEKDPQPPVTPPVKPVKPVKATAEKLPARVAGGTSLWVRTTGLDGTRVVITWNPTKKGARTITRRAVVKDGLLSVHVPRRTGRHRVTLVATGTKVRTSRVRVL